MDNATQFLKDNNFPLTPIGSVKKYTSLTVPMSGMPKLVRVFDGPHWNEWNTDIYYNVLDIVSGKKVQLAHWVLERDYDDYR